MVKAFLALTVALVSCGTSPATRSTSSRLEATPSVTVTPIAAIDRYKGGHPRTPLAEAPDGRLWIVGWQNGPNDGGDAEHSCSSNYSWLAEDDHVQKYRCPGALASMRRDGSDYRVEHAFTWIDPTTGRNEDGYQPLGRLHMSDDGWAYGTTRLGGLGGTTASKACGIDYRIKLDGSQRFERLWSHCSLARFADGSNPQGSLMPDGFGSFLAVAKGGSTGGGVIYRLTGTAVANVYTFSASATDRTNREGAVPYAGPTRGADGAWYGVTIYGGEHAEGSIFRYPVPAPGQLAIVAGTFSFDAAPDTTNDDNAPFLELVDGEDGNLYGVHSYAGPHGTGQVFRVSPGGAVSILHTFSAISLDTRPYRFSNPDGAQPLGRLLFHDGWLYGTVKYGGAYGAGGIVRTRRDGSQHELVHSFKLGGIDPGGNYPAAGLMRASDGALYGVTAGGGETGFGVVYRVQVSP